jgi:TRAP-type C4-dicarboxylate transport system permease small subunit
VTQIEGTEMGNGQTERILDFIHRCLFRVLIGMASVMLIIGFMQVFWRYVLQASLSWSEELLRYMYVWVIFLGVSLGIRKRIHVAIEAFITFLEGRVRYTFVMFVHLLTVVFFVLVVVIGIRFTIHNLGQTSPAIQLPMSLVYIAIPLGGCLALLFAIEEWVKAAKAGGNP